MINMVISVSRTAGGGLEWSIWSLVSPGRQEGPRMIYICSFMLMSSGRQEGPRMINVVIYVDVSRTEGGA
jgi:hypothetical protein